jgi:hypothetical protein
MHSMIRLGTMMLLVATAVIHVYLAIPAHLIGFYVNAIGYFILLGLYAAPTQRFPRERTVLIIRIWTVSTLVLWLVIGDRSLLAFADKIIELCILGLLWLEERIPSR